ncbi:hypothetical protein EMIT0232MI5_40431 [Pseudomonas sp. IT-232MI5]
MGQPQQRRLAPAFASSQIPQTAIIETAAHAQAPADIVKPYQRQQHQIQRPDFALLRQIGARLENAEAIGFEFFPGTNALENHLGPRPGAEHRQVGRFAATLGFTQQQARIDFTVGGQIQRDVSGPAKVRVLRQLPVQALGSLALFAFAQRTARLAQQAAELRAGQQRGFGHGSASAGWVQKRTHKKSDGGFHRHRIRIRLPG